MESHITHELRRAGPAQEPVNRAELEHTPELEKCTAPRRLQRFVSRSRPAFVNPNPELVATESAREALFRPVSA
jgi:hypothetical protein